MSWALLARFWKPLTAAALVIASSWYWHHAGYVSGHAASEAHWKPLFAEAERARDAANAEARRKETASTDLSDRSEKEHAAQIASLNLRAADAEQRIRALSVRLAAASARRCDVPAVSGPTAVPDATSASTERAERAAASIGDTGRRCEADAITLASLQRWVTEQRAIARSQ